MNERKQKFFWVGIGLVLLALFVVLLFLLVSSVAEKERYLSVVFLDVGQGDAVFIETPNRTQVLVDGGRDTTVLSELGAVMPFFDRSIDMVIATHHDQDHVGGLVPVVENFKIKKALETGVVNDTGTSRELVDLYNVQGIEVQYVVRGTEIILDAEHDVVLEILYPTDHDLSGIDLNDASIAMTLRHGEVSWLFTGDASVDVESYLIALEDDDELDVDVLKLGHHGSKTSTSEQFLLAASPSLAIVLAGKDNRYGHPHREVTDRLAQFEIPYMGTHREGRIIMKSDGISYWVE